MRERRPSILVWSSLFPNPAQPQSGIFIRERMFRVASELPLTVISPQPWFPLQGLIRLFRPYFRPGIPTHEMQEGVEVFRPRYLSVPGFLKRLDGVLMAIGAASTVRRLQRQGRVDIIDAHFTYPDGSAATMVARWLSVPVTVTMRGTEVRHSRDPSLRHQLEKALGRASRIFSVSSSLKTLAVEMGVDPERVRVVGNGVDSGAFRPGDRQKARRVLELEDDALVLVTVGGLVERKGFHRVIACLPELISRFPKVHYLVVGGPGPEGDYSPELLKQVRDLGLTERVRFLGALPRDGVRQALSASDVFVLSSRNEGWANVLLEAMACGLPVVATDVGGNAEVVCRADLGTIVPFGDSAALASALEGALERSWDRSAIRHYAEQNDWSGRVAILVEEFRHLGGCDPAVAPYLDNAR